MIEYRIATEADIDALAEMRWDFRIEEAEGQAVNDKPTFLAACREFLRKGLHNDEWTYWVATSDGEIVSHIFVLSILKVPKPNRLEDADGYVTNVYTRPAYRGHGIGSELMNHVTAWAKEQDLGTLFVWPSERSIAYYERAGFVGHSELMEYEVRPYVS